MIGRQPVGPVGVGRRDRGAVGLQAWPPGQSRGTAKLVAPAAALPGARTGPGRPPGTCTAAPRSGQADRGRALGRERASGRLA
jgi:hypothetical protein